MLPDTIPEKKGLGHETNLCYGRLPHTYDDALFILVSRHYSQDTMGEARTVTNGSQGEG